MYNLEAYDQAVQEGYSVETFKGVDLHGSLHQVAVGELHARYRIVWGVLHGQVAPSPVQEHDLLRLDVVEDAVDSDAALKAPLRVNRLEMCGGRLEDRPHQSFVGSRLCQLSEWEPYYLLCEHYKVVPLGQGDYSLLPCGWQEQTALWTQFSHTLSGES